MPYRSTYGMYGDPGFFGGLLKGIGKVAKVAGKIGKAVPGIGTAISAIELGSGLGKALAGGPLKRIGLPPGAIIGSGSTGIVAPGSFGPGPRLPQIPGTMPGGSPTAYGGGSGGRSRSGANGYRRYRRMNVGNVRALRRSMRRVEGFAKLARQTITFTKQVRMKKRRSR